MNRDIKGEECKTTDPSETMNMFRDPNEDDIVKGIDKDKTPMSDPKYKLPLHVIPDEG